MSAKRLAKDLEPGDVVSFGGHYGPGDDIVKSVIKSPEGVIVYTERGGEFSVSENTTFDFVGTERRRRMSDELDQLRVRLDILNQYQHWVFTRDAIKSTQDKIARLEVEQDPWREAKEFASAYRDPNAHKSSNLQKLIAHYDHLTAENERLTKRVAELEEATEPPFEANFNVDPKAEKAVMDAAVEFMDGMRKAKPSRPHDHDAATHQNAAAGTAAAE